MQKLVRGTARGLWTARADLKKGEREKRLDQKSMCVEGGVGVNCVGHCRP